MLHFVFASHFPNHIPKRNEENKHSTRIYKSLNQMQLKKFTCTSLERNIECLIQANPCLPQVTLIYSNKVPGGV